MIVVVTKDILVCEKANVFVGIPRYNISTPCIWNKHIWTRPHTGNNPFVLDNEYIGIQIDNILSNIPIVDLWKHFGHLQNN